MSLRRSHRIAVRDRPPVWGFFIKTLSGQLFPVRVPAESTIAELKHQIHQYKGVAPEQQKLVFGKRELLDNEVINSGGDNALTDGAEITLMLSLRGWR